MKKNYVYNLLKSKYNHLRKVKDYDQCFTANDGLYFYQCLGNIGIFEPSQEAKQAKWNELRSTKSQWWNKERQPQKFEMMNLCKAMLFKDWIVGHAELNHSIEEVYQLKQKINEN